MWAETALSFHGSKWKVRQEPQGRAWLPAEDSLSPKGVLAITIQIFPNVHQWYQNILKKNKTKKETNE